MKKQNKTWQKIAQLAALTTFTGLALSACAPAGPPAEAYELKLGVSFYQEGYPASFEEAAAELAVSEINAANLGIKIELVPAEPFVAPPVEEPETPATPEPSEETENPDGEEGSETDPTTPETEEPTTPEETELPASAITSLLAKKPHFILGGTELAVSENIVKELIAAKIPLISAAIPDPEAYRWSGDGLYLRVQPTQELLGKALGQRLVLDSKEFIGITGVNSLNSALIREGLQWEIEPTLSQVVVEGFYEENEVILNSAIDLVLNQRPPAIVVLASAAEASEAVQILLKAGYPAADLYLSDTSLVNFSAQPLEADLTGVKGISREFIAPEDFKTKLGEYLATLTVPEQPAASDSETDRPALKALNIERASDAQLSKAAYIYDSVHLVALATLAQGGVSSPSAIAKKLIEISKPQESAVAVTEFAAAAQAIFDGKKIDFDGIVGSLALDNNGQAELGTFSLVVLDKTGKVASRTNFSYPDPAFEELLPKDPNSTE